MSYDEYIKDLDQEDLHNLIARCNSKLKEYDEMTKEKYLVVSDDSINLGFFRMDNVEGALELLAKEARKAGVLMRYPDRLEIKVEKWYKKDIEDLVKEKL